VNKRPTLLNIYAALSSTSAGAVEVAAKLVDRFDVTQPMAGQSVVFTLGTQTVPVTTNAEGIAVAVLTFAPGVVNTVTATYAGDGFYVPAADTDSFNPVSVFPETPSLRNDQSEIVALVPSDGGRVQNGGVLSTVGFAAGYAPLILVVDPLVVGDATKANPLPGFDTVALNGICDIGSNTFLGNATFRNRVQDFVVRGGKLIIWDSECQNTDYSKFFLPFTTNNPGALGASGTLQDVEENALSSSDPLSPAFVNVGLVSTGTDAVGDANVFLTFDPNWCVDMKAKNAVLPDFKPVHTYAVLGRGLLLYSGFDRDAMQSNASASPNSGAFFLARIWERELKQAWNPSGLPCDVAATQATIVLAPTSATLDVGQTHTVTATVTDVNGTPIRSVFVNLVVTGANPFTQQGTTNLHVHGHSPRERRARGGGGGHSIELRERALERGPHRRRGGRPARGHGLRGHPRRQPLLRPQPRRRPDLLLAAAHGPRGHSRRPGERAPPVHAHRTRRPRLRAARERRPPLRYGHGQDHGRDPQPAARGPGPGRGDG